jgi:osmotically-inducible protein OsmY
MTIFELVLWREVLNQRMAASVERALRGANFCAFSALKVSVDNGHVTLQGRVDQYYFKQLAQALAMSVDGVEAIDNQITVV